jgi:hypothetical protein
MAVDLGPTNAAWRLWTQMGHEPEGEQGWADFWADLRTVLTDAMGSHGD